MKRFLQKIVSLKVVFLLLLSYNGKSQDLPSFLVDNPYNFAREYNWENDYVHQVALPDTFVSMEGHTIIRKFLFNADIGPMEVRYGGRRGNEFPGVFFDEHLPSFFKKRLSFDDFQTGSGRFEWIFTGDKGGFTVSIDKDSIWLFQRFYDSYALNSLEESKLLAKRHPEKIWTIAQTAYQGELKNIDISVSHNLELKLIANGVTIATQMILHDVTQHQLRCTSTDAIIDGEAMEPEPKICNVSGFNDIEYQEMLGFGGIGISTAYQELSEEGKDKWWEIVNEYNLLIHREYPIGQKLNREMDNWDKMEDATPHYYGDNFPNGEISDFSYIKQIQDMGGLNIFEFWKLPPWVQPSEDVNVDAYVEAMVGYCKTAQRKTGYAPDILGIQNEVIQKPETWHAMTLKLRVGLDKAGFDDVKIHMHNASFLNRGVDVAKIFTARPEVWNAIDYSAVNMYDYQALFTSPDGYDSLLLEFRKLTSDKPFLSTEISVNAQQYQIPSYRIAFQMGQLYYKNLTIADASAILYCWTILNNVHPSYTATRSLFGIDKQSGFVPAPFGFQDRVYGGFSRRVKKGMKRIEVQSSDSNLLAVGFTGEEGKQQTLILLNRDTAPIQVNIDGMGHFTWQETTSQYNRNHISDVKETVIIQPGEIITLTNVPLNGSF